jgi:DNA-binding NarL/FixJ family response regulator
MFICTKVLNWRKRALTLKICVNFNKVQKTHKILIAEGNEYLLEGLVAVIAQESNFNIVGTARNEKELIIEAVQCSPEICLVDFDLPGLNGIHVSQALLERNKTFKIIILIDSWENSLIRRIRATGVTGCLLKSCDANEIIYAIYQVLNGNEYFSGYSWSNHP